VLQGVSPCDLGSQPIIGGVLGLRVREPESAIGGRPGAAFFVERPVVEVPLFGKQDDACPVDVSEAVPMYELTQ
jgi:hypothetical protein